MIPHHQSFEKLSIYILEASCRIIYVNPCCWLPLGLPSHWITTNSSIIMTFSNNQLCFQGANELTSLTKTYFFKLLWRWCLRNVWWWYSFFGIRVTSCMLLIDCPSINIIMLYSFESSNTNIWYYHWTWCLKKYRAGEIPMMLDSVIFMFLLWIL